VFPRGKGLGKIKKSLVKRGEKASRNSRGKVQLPPSSDNSSRKESKRRTFKKKKNFQKPGRNREKGQVTFELVTRDKARAREKKSGGEKNGGLEKKDSREGPRGKKRVPDKGGLCMSEMGEGL